jgi:hypothetical protein
MKIGNKLKREIRLKEKEKRKEIGSHGACLVQIGDFKYSTCYNQREK